MKSKLIVCGAAGRMGKRIICLAVETGRFEIIGVVEKQGHPEIGKDAAVTAGSAGIGVKITDTLPVGADVVIDFSLPEAADTTIAYCLENNCSLVMGTTGLRPEQAEKIKTASRKIPIIYGTNMSVGMNVLFSLVGKTASMLGDDYDIEIIEQHHRFKKDAPSGSAMTLAENVCSETKRNFPDCIDFGRAGDCPREKGHIGIHAVRAGDIAGVHSVMFTTLGETVTLSHNAHSRDGFAKGSLLAAVWLTGKKAGNYSMSDVLGIKP